MKKINFELSEEPNLSFYDTQHVMAEISLSGELIDDYLQAFKAFLIACGFTEELVSTIQTEEQFYLNQNKDLTNEE